MSRSLERLLKLARRTGDRLIVHDPTADEDIVIMSINQYEHLLDAQEDLETYMEDFEAIQERLGQKQSKPLAREVVRDEQYIPEDDREYEQPVMSTPSVQVGSDASPSVLQNETMPLPDERLSPPPRIQEAVHPITEELPPLEPEEGVSPVLPSEPEYHPLGEQPAQPPANPRSSWTPASTLLEDKFRALTSGTSTVAQLRRDLPDMEPRRVPMVQHEAEMDDIDEEGDEPIFFEEPV